MCSLHCSCPCAPSVATPKSQPHITITILTDIYLHVFRCAPSSARSSHRWGSQRCPPTTTWSHRSGILMPCSSHNSTLHVTRMTPSSSQRCEACPKHCSVLCIAHSSSFLRSSLLLTHQKHLIIMELCSDQLFYVQLKESCFPSHLCALQPVITSADRLPQEYLQRVKVRDTYDVLIMHM